MLLKDDSAGGAKRAHAAAALTSLCDVYTRHDLEGKWRELAKVYEQRKNDDNLREILDLSAPSTRLSDLHGWHLERMAVGELGGESGAAAGDVAVIRQDSRRIKHVLRKALANGEAYRAKREQVVTTMVKQRDVLLSELEAAKEFLEQIHSGELADAAVVELTTPAPVEKRLLATVKPPEASANVDLSAAPSI